MTAKIGNDLNKAYASVIGSLEKNSPESKRMCPAAGQRLSRVGWRARSSDSLPPLRCFPLM